MNANVDVEALPDVDMESLGGAAVASYVLPARFCVVSRVFAWLALQSMSASAFDYPTKLWHFPLDARAEVLRRVR